MPEPAPGHPPVDLRIQLLGGFSIIIGDHTIGAAQFRLRKSRSLVKLLALTPGHHLHRDQLVERLWPDQDPQSAANSFYQVLYETRRILDPAGTHSQSYLQLHEAILSLCPDTPVLIDAEAFKTAANRAFRTQDQAALALYSGDLLPDDLYEDWSSEMRETLHQEHLRLLVGLAKFLENKQEYRPAIETIKQALDADALNEEAHTALMRLYAATGQRQLALRQYQVLEETLQRELDAKPDPSTTRLYQEILSGRYLPPETPPELAQDPPGIRTATGMPAPPTHNLPVQITSFVGREREKQDIKRLLFPRPPVTERPQEKENVQRSSARLVTLTGTGGCGKTRLALETASELLENYPDGVWLGELASLSDPDLVPQTLISALRIQNASGQPLPLILADFLKHKQLLLVLDNCEHLVEACARLVETLLKSCPHLQILVTSQEILGLPGEVAYSISPLSLPDPLHLLPAEITAQSEAVRLFVERAGYALPTFTLNETNASAVVKICQRLDGIPLAIELAAARVKMMQVGEIAARLEQSFDLLNGGSRTALPRYQSLLASIDWSYGLLSEAERIIFRRLAVFAGGWSLDAARYVTAGSHLLAGPADLAQLTEDLLELLIQLVNKSLITPHQIPGEPTRYFYLDTIRRFALDRLREAGEEEWMRDQHLDYFEQLAVNLAPLLRGPEMMATMNHLEAENDNLRTAMEWSLAAHPPHLLSEEIHQAGHPQTHLEKGLRLAAALARFWHYLFSRTEAVFWLERLLAGEAMERGSRSLDPHRALARANALYVLGWISRGDIDQNQKYLEDSLVISREAGPAGCQGAAYALYELAVLANYRGDYQQAQALTGESLALFQEVGDSFGLAGLLNGPLTYLVWDQGNFDQARKYTAEALAIYQELGDQDGIAWADLRLGEIAAREGNYPQAWTLMEIALDLWGRIDSKSGNYLALEQMGKAARAQGDPQHAEAIFSEALDLARQVGDRALIAVSLRNLARAAFDQGEYASASQRYQESLETGREIEDPSAISHALRGLAEVSLAAQGAGDKATALKRFKEALQVKGNPPDLREIYRSLEALATLAVDLGQPELAARLFSATQDLYNSVRYSFWPLHRYNRAEIVSRLKSQLGELAFDEVWSQGQALTLEQAIQLALSL